MDHKMHEAHQDMCVVDGFWGRVGPTIDRLGLVDCLGEPGHEEVNQGLVVVPRDKAEQVSPQALYCLVNVGICTTFSSAAVICEMMCGEPVAVSCDQSGAVADVAHHRAKRQLQQRWNIAPARHSVRFDFVGRFGIKSP